MMNPHIGLILICLSLVSYLTCVIVSFIVFLYNKQFVLPSLISQQIFSHIFLLLGLFLSKQTLIDNSKNLKNLFHTMMIISSQSFLFLSIISGVFAAVEFFGGKPPLFQFVQTALYLNLYFVYGKK